MDTSFNLSASALEAKKLLVSRIVAQVKNPENKLRPIFLVGHSGIGKTQIVRQAAEEASKILSEDVHTKTTSLVFVEPPEFMGLGYIEKGETKFARPSLLPKDGIGILFFDEANRVNREIKNGLLTLIEDREVNGHKLGSQWIIVLAGNPPGDRYETTEFDPALAERVCPINFKGNSVEVIKYLDNKYPEHFMTTFLKDNTDFIDFEAKSRHTPRGIEYTMRATKHIPMGDVAKDNKELFTLLAAELGVDSASHIVTCLTKKLQDLTWEDITTNKKRTLKFIKDNKDNSDVTGRISKKVSDNLQLIFDGYSREKEQANTELLPETQVENLVAFMETIPDENKLAILKSLTDEGKQYDYNLEYVFKKTFLDKSKKLVEFINRIIESQVEETKKTK